MRTAVQLCKIDPLSRRMKCLSNNFVFNSETRLKTSNGFKFYETASVTTPVRKLQENDFTINVTAKPCEIKTCLSPLKGEVADFRKISRHSAL
jgi:hypothetical protein